MYTHGAVLSGEMQTDHVCVLDPLVDAWESMDVSFKSQLDLLFQQEIRPKTLLRSLTEGEMSEIKKTKPKTASAESDDQSTTTIGELTSRKAYAEMRAMGDAITPAHLLSNGVTVGQFLLTQWIEKKK